ncbi:O-antigen polymerase [Variovorax paradoxus]|uniref:O-antigen polymerase n=1 Tax=Variovorax paradoxus TaxID=34073 RepID=UPI003D65AAE1
MNLLISFVFTLLTALFVSLFKRHWIVNPVILFLLFNWIIGIGIIYQLNLTDHADLLHCVVLLLSVAGIGVGAFTGALDVATLSTQKFSSSYRNFWAEEENSERKFVFRRVKLVFVFSLLITIIYYYVIGYNLTLVAFNPAIDDVTTARLNAYAGEDYYAPGIVNQFKNTLLPICFLILATKIERRKYKLIFVASMIPVLVYALAGTGQRTFIAIFLIMLAVSLMALRRGAVRIAYFVVPAVVGFLVFMYLSVQLGRSEGGIFAGAEELLRRVFYSNQFAAVHGFRFIQQEEVQYGSDWWRSIVGLLPGVAGSDIANRIFADLFGGTRGTAPLSVWGSVFYNFGLLGVFPVAFAIGFIYIKIYHFFLKGEFTKVRVIVYGALFTYLSIWIAGSPVQLLNNGVLAVLLLLALRRYRINL